MRPNDMLKSSIFGSCYHGANNQQIYAMFHFSREGSEGIGLFDFPCNRCGLNGRLLFIESEESPLINLASLSQDNQTWKH
jgi:hypothetical protein